MGATVIITSRTWEDLSEIIDYIAKDSPTAAEELIESQKENRLFFGISV